MSGLGGGARSTECHSH